MITLNGKKFAENEEEFASALFVKGGTCRGYYKVNKASVTLQDFQRVKIGVINKHGVLCSASLIDGSWWYSYATIPEVGEYESYILQVEEPRRIISELCQ